MLCTCIQCVVSYTWHALVHYSLACLMPCCVSTPSSVPPATTLLPFNLACVDGVQGQRVNYCKVFGDPNKVADACKANPSCKAFTMINNGEGYLKTATGPTRYMETAATYTLG